MVEVRASADVAIDRLALPPHDLRDILVIHLWEKLATAQRGAVVFFDVVFPLLAL